MMGTQVPSPTKRLLVVDDDRLVLSTTASGLAEAGYEVMVAESAEDAQNLLAGGERPDLAILDVRMAGLGGLYLAQRLSKFDHIPFIMLSALSESKIVEEATHYGAMGYAVKPMDIRQLIPAIESALVRAHELEDLRQTRQQLQKALDAERDISVAIGIVMVNKKLTRRDAFAFIRDTSRKQRRKLAELAADAIETHERIT